jgi:hypothetical protein
MGEQAYQQTPGLQSPLARYALIARLQFCDFKLLRILRHLSPRGGNSGACHCICPDPFGETALRWLNRGASAVMAGAAITIVLE